MAKDASKKSFLDFFKIKNLDDDEFDDDLFDDDDDDDDDDDYVRPSKSAKTVSKAAPARSQAPARSTSGYGTSSYSSASSASSGYTQSRPAATSSSKLVDINQRPRRQGSGSSEVYVIKPEDLGDAQTVADFLNSGMTIVINMEGIELTLAQRVIDIVYGACYAMGGSLNPISNNIFIAAPGSIEVTGDLRDEIMSSPQLS